MELVCIEVENYKECKSYFDPVFIEDERVLKNLLSTQDRYIIQSSYFKCVQKDISVFMREEVANWMLEVCFFHQINLKYKLIILCLTN